MQYNTSNATGDAGVGLVSFIIPKKLNWIFRAQEKSDTGIDGQLEVVDENHIVTGHVIAAQIKSGQSYLSRKSDSGFVYYGEDKHLEYWSANDLPAVLFLCDTDDEVVYWQHITKPNIEYTDKGWKTIVPYENVLSTESAADLSALVDFSNYRARLNRLILDRPLMEQALRDGAIPVTCYTNTDDFALSVTLYSNKRDHIIAATDVPDSEGLEAMLEHLFPWAEVDIDAVAYEDEDTDRHEQECGLRDSNSEPAYGYTMEFEDWLNDQPTLRPHEYSEHNGEKYSLLFTVNSLGLSFMQLDDFLRVQADVPLPKIQRS